MTLNVDAPRAWNLLKGFVCLYKPPNTTAKKVKNIFLGNLVEDLNNLSGRSPKPYVRIEGDTSKPLKVSVIESYADNPLVVGPRYQVEDFKYQWATYPGAKTSGVVLFVLNRKALLHTDHTTDPDLDPNPLLENPWPHCIKAYHLHGKLGMVTDNMYSSGKVLYDSVKYHFVRSDHMDKVLSSLQANYQKRMFQQAGVQVGSQAAYELAVQGPIRPADLSEPVVYGLKCVHFKPPDFTIEVHCIGEYEEFLIRLIYDLGQKLRSAAICTGVQCIRYAQFTLEHSLLRKHWRLEHVIENIGHNEKLVDEMTRIQILPQLQDIQNTSNRACKT
uniref:Probable tRNA pseudouridine synthase 2 n=1 Tax=Cacopsylla melanoneura TaxID=428564 RepID=A0A8D8LUV8_9HEMI